MEYAYTFECSLPGASHHGYLIDVRATEDDVAFDEARRIADVRSEEIALSMVRKEAA